jgi:hypothetical protein
MVCPPMVKNPTRATAASKRLSRTSIVGAPAIVARAGRAAAVTLTFRLDRSAGASPLREEDSAYGEARFRRR